MFHVGGGKKTKPGTKRNDCSPIQQKLCAKRGIIDCIDFRKGTSEQKKRLQESQQPEGKEVETGQDEVRRGRLRTQRNRVCWEKGRIAEFHGETGIIDPKKVILKGLKKKKKGGTAGGRIT